MKSITHNQLKGILKRCYATKVPPFVWGAPGIGKSETVKQTAMELADELKLKFYQDVNGQEGFGLIDQRLSQFDPSDLRGLFYIDKDGKTKCAYPDYLPRMGQGILLFDELNLAPPLVQSSAYQLILDRRLGGYKLPDGWMIIAAGNRTEDRAHIFEMAAPLASRFVHVELSVPSIDSWTTWALQNNIDSRIVTFLNFNPTYLFKFNPKSSDRAFPNPRSWGRYCSSLIKGMTLQASQDEEEVHTAIASSVGEGVANECLAYIRLADTLNLDALLENPEKVGKLKGIDQKYAILGGLVEKAKNKTNLTKVCKCTDYLETEFSILLLRMMKARIGNFEKLVRESKVLQKYLATYVKFLVE